MTLTVTMKQYILFYAVYNNNNYKTIENDCCKFIKNKRYFYSSAAMRVHRYRTLHTRSDSSPCIFVLFLFILFNFLVKRNGSQGRGRGKGNLDYIKTKDTNKNQFFKK